MTGKHQALIDNYKKAKELSKNDNYSNEMIRQETGWFQNKNGNWEYEISDENSKMLMELSNDNEYYLGDIFKHNALYKMYPELTDLKVKTSNIKTNGRIDVDNGIIYLKNSNKNIQKTLLHEIQHYIQRVEGFPSGTAIILGNEQYANNLGEIEASDVSKRMNYNAEKRLEIMPESAKDNPIHPNREAILNRKRNLIEKFVEKTYNNKYEKANKKNFKENNSLGGLNEDVDNTSFSLTSNELENYNERRKNVSPNDINRSKGKTTNK